MDSRERIHRLLDLQEADRVGFVDFPWGTTIDRWEEQGLPRGVFIQEYFNMDIYGIGVDVSPKYDEITCSQSENWVIVRDRFGVKEKRWRGVDGVPLPMEPAFRNLEEFEERIEPLLDPESPIRISSSKYPFKGEIEDLITHFQEKFFVFASIFGPFEYCRHVCGGTRLLLRFMMTDKRLTRKMFKCLGRFLGAISSALADAGADCVWSWDDLGFRDGPFFSPSLYEKYLLPCHAQINRPFRKRGLPCVLHSDGNVNVLVPQLIRAGFTVLQPMEAKAGMDVVQLKERYGDRLAFIGNIDARTICTNNIELIRDEVLKKMGAAASGGGYVLCSDHSIPPDVTLDTFKAFSEMARKYGRYD